MLVLPFEVVNSTVRALKSGRLKINVSVEAKADGDKIIVLEYRDVLLLLQIVRGIHGSTLKMFATEQKELDAETLRTRSFLPHFKICQSIGEIAITSGRMEVQVTFEVKNESGERIPLGDGTDVMNDAFKVLMEQFERLALVGYRRLSQSRMNIDNMDVV